MLPRSWKLLAAFALVLTLGLGAAVVSAQTPRSIAQVWPQPGQNEVDVGSAVSIDFNQFMNPATTAAAFRIEPAVAGKTAWSADYKRLEFLPDEPLAARTLFKATLAATATDSQGRPILTQPYSWSFTTGQADDRIRFSYGVPVQLVTPAGGKGVPIQPGVARLTVDATLYPVSLAEFATRYAKLKPYEKTQIPTAGLTPAASWRQWLDASQKMPALDLPKGTATGLYLLDVRNPVLGAAQTFVIHSDYGLIAKSDDAATTVWTSRLFSGEPAAGIRTALHDAAGAELPGLFTQADVDGIARLAQNPAARFAVVSVDGAPVSLTGLDQYWANDGYWWGGWDRGGMMYRPYSPDFAGHVFTDRPIYRPGHTAHYKATLRRFDIAGYRALEPTVPLTVTIHDNQGNTLATSHPTLDEFGSLSGDLVLGEDVGLGTWNVEVNVANRQSFWGYFEVQAYVKPDFEVTVAPAKPFYVRGDLARFDVNARYYFGQPAAGADATLRLYRGYYSAGNTPTVQVTGKLDQDGAWSTDVLLKDDGGSGGDYTEYWYMEAEVIDAARRPVVAQGSVPVHPADFTLSLTNDQYGVEVGQPVRLTASTIAHDGTPVAGRKVLVTVQQYTYNGQRSLRDLSVTTGPDGTAPVTLAGMGEGWYSVQGSATDDRGHRVNAYSYAWLFDKAQPWYWWGGLEVAADKPTYAAGDSARLLIKSPITTTALVTLERENVYEELVVPVSGATAVEVPIKAEYAPNVLARVYLWQPTTYEGNRAEGQLLTAEVNLLVPATERKLGVVVTPDKATYEPGEEATWTLAVTDAKGQPVRAQVALALVDKSVLALAADRNGDIFDAFWSSRWQRVDTFNSLQPSNWYGYKEDAGAPGRGGGQPPSPSPTGTPAAANPGDTASQAKPRREFPDTAYWNPTLVTGPDGTVRVTLKMPDTLTTWNALARAVTVDTMVGQGKGEAVVTKAIMADPALPRFAVQGDEFALDVLARNYAGGTLDAVCSLDTPGLVQLDSGDKTLSLPFNETKFARWSVVASKLGENPVTARVATAKGDDAIELPLTVLPFTAPDRFVRSGGVKETVTESFEVPFNAEPTASKVELRLAPAMAVSVLDGLESLIDYPYGCVEQTMSRVLPNAVIGRLVLALDITAPEITKRLPEMMALGLQKLYGFQNGDGSWGWWQGEGNVYTTAYVLQGLTLTRAGGFEVDPDVLQKGFNWLAANVDAEADQRLKAYALYVLAEAGRADAERLAALYGSAGTLDSFSLAALAIGLERAGNAELSERALDLLVARASETATTATWPLPELPKGRWWYEDSYYWRSMASTEKSTAMALEALSLLRPTSPLAPKAARWLLESRYGQGWQSTQATAYAVLALTDYIHASGELRSNYTWTVRLDGAVLAEGRVDGSNVTQRLDPIVLSGDTLTAGKHELTLEKQGEGTLFYTALGKLALYYDGFAATSANGIGMTLKREYLPVDGTTATGSFHAGDVLNVRLTLSTQEDLWYVMLEDPLPAGIEGLNEQLDTETKRVPGQDPWYPWKWRWWGYERKELRDTAVSFYATRLPAGTHTFDYAARAVTPGTFSARPAEAAAMYRPEIWARSESARVMVDPERITSRPKLAGDFDRDCRLTAFDASLVAAEWAKRDGRDLTGDGKVTVADVAVANGRVGALCGEGVANPPGKAGDMDLRLRVVGTPTQYQPFVVELVASGRGNVGGFEATLDFAPDKLEVLKFEAGPGLADARLLGPDRVKSELRLGGFLATGREAGGETVLARLTLKPLIDYRADLKVNAAQIVTDKGGEYTVTANGVVVSPEPWRPVGKAYLPLLQMP